MPRWHDDSTDEGPIGPLTVAVHDRRMEQERVDW